MLPKIKGNTVRVKTLPSGTKFVTLDGVERTLHEDDLMICNDSDPMCIAGVFGGMESGVTEETTSIFLESAYFDPVSIRKTAKRHGLNTDASFRFERGIDPNITEYALMRAAIMMLEIAGGEISSDLVDVYPKKINDHQVLLNFDNATRIIGQEIPRETIKEILTSLDIKIENVTESGIGMTIPAYRNDVTREVDVIEEVLRVYGYNEIEFGTKLNASVASTSRIEDHLVQNKVGEFLASIGFYEMLANSLTNENHIALSNLLSEEQQIKMLNPLSQDLGVLRQSMLFGALEALSYNTNRKMADAKFFEFGKTYHQLKNERQEQKHLALLISGARNAETWTSGAQKSDFFFGKGVATSILDRLGITGYTEASSQNDLLSEGITLELNKKPLANLGVVNKKVCKAFDIEAEVIYIDFQWDYILEVISTDNILMEPIPRFPLVRRDFALLLDESVSFDALKQAAFKTEKQLLRDINLFDVYTGKSLPKGKKSYALSFMLQDDRKTLTEKQIDKIMNKLQNCFEKEFGAELR